MSWQYPPRIVQWDITSRCNLKCRHCRAANLDIKAKDLNFRQVVSILGKIDSLCPKAHLAVAGGEPLMRKDLKDIFYLIKERFSGLKIELLTNATLIDEKNIDWLLKTVKGFNISLEGASTEINDSIRGRGAFQKTVETIKLLIEKGAKTSVRMTYFHQGEDEPEKLLYFLSELGIKFFNFRYLVPVGRALRKKIDAEQHKRLCQKIWELGKKLEIDVGFSDPFPEILLNEQKQKEIKNDPPLLKGKAVTGCSVAFTLLYLNPQGIVQYCPYLPINIADAKEVDFKKLWFEGKDFKLFRYTRSLLKGKCGDCEYKFACGGCRGAAWAKGDFLGEDSRCWKR